MRTRLLVRFRFICFFFHWLATSLSSILSFPVFFFDSTELDRRDEPFEGTRVEPVFFERDLAMLPALQQYEKGARTFKISPAQNFVAKTTTQIRSHGLRFVIRLPIICFDFICVLIWQSPFCFFMSNSFEDIPPEKDFSEPLPGDPSLISSYHNIVVW